MKIFFDSGRLEQLTELVDWGITDGVATNPSQLQAAEGNPGPSIPGSTESSKMAR